MNPASKGHWLKYLPLAVLVGLFVGLAGFFFFVLHSFSAGSSRGPVEDRAEWPEPLRAVLAKASLAKINVEPVRVFRIVDFTEKMYYWRMRSSPELITLMINEWQLKPGTKDELDRFWRLSWPSEWEVGARHGRETFLGNYQQPSDNFIVIANESEPVLYGYYYFNF
jgi:hypothetical protein